MAGSLGWRREGYDVRRESVDSRDLNFTQRLLMANENAVNSVADLWVAAAINADNEDPFESDYEDEAAAVPEQPEEDDNDDAATIDSSLTQRGRGTSTKRLGLSSINPMSRRPSRGFAHPPSRGSRPPRSHFSASRHASSPQAIPRLPSFSVVPGITPLVRRRSSTSVPSIFSHAGVEMPRAVLDAQDILTRLEEGIVMPDGLHPILESRQPSDASGSDTEGPTEKPPSLLSQLPLQVILQYGLFALHTTTHDQVFMSYLVS